MARRPYSTTTLWGDTIHYDARGNEVGRSKQSFWGGTDHYDAKGNKIGHSEKSFWGGVDHYDARGDKVGHSETGFWGTSHSGETFGTGSFASRGSGMSHRSEYDAIESEMMDESYDSDDAREWLEDNGYQIKFTKYANGAKQSL